MQRHFVIFQENLQVAIEFHFEKGWVKSFCPKLITVERYETQGPFKTKLEMKTALSNANK